jgi:hypothetical protein
VYELLSTKTTDDLIAAEGCTVATIKIRDLTKALGGALKDIVAANKQRQQLKQEQETYITNALRTLKLEDLIALKHLGAG